MEVCIKVIGLIGGTGWVSTQTYYRYLNEMVNARLGGLNAARCVLWSFNYAEIDTHNRNGDARSVYGMVRGAAGKLEAAGAECLLLCANTLHQFADELSGETRLPIIHIAEATGDEILRQGYSTVGLLGTRMTMEGDFYTARLRRKGIDVLTPEKDEREFIHQTILTELLKDVFAEDSRRRFVGIIDSLARRGAEGVVLGCTEIPLLVRPGDTDLPLIDTLQLHCRSAVDFSLASDNIDQ